MPEQERRSNRRYSLREPAYLRVANPEQRTLAAITENISTGGVLLVTDCALPVGSAVEVLVIMGPAGTRNVRLGCGGTVLRVQPVPSNGKYAVAVGCARAFSELGEN